MNTAPAPRFSDAEGNGYLGLGIDDALDLAAMLARLLDVIDSPGVTDALEELLGTAGNLAVGDDVSSRLCELGHLIAASPTTPAPGTRPGSPLRDAAATASCLVCGVTLAPSPNKRYCSALCRATAWRRRHANSRPAIPPLLPARSRRSSTVYECDGCGSRLLGEQRCECGRFMRRVGAGGQCPHCDEAVALSDLVDEEVMPGLG
jgi:hypothetical protein